MTEDNLTAAPVSGMPARWRTRFFTIWSGQAASMVGSALVRFALVWWITTTTGSAMALTVATLASILPVIILGPFAGALIDRWHRRWVIIVSDAYIALATVVLAYLFWIGAARLWHVYLILFLRAIGDAFHAPAVNAATSLMVPKNRLAQVGGMNETLQGVVTIVSPPLGALLLETLSMQGTLAIDVLTALLAIAPLCFFRIPEPPEHLRSAVSVPGSIREGLSFVWKWRGLKYGLIALAALRFFLAPCFSMLPLIVTEDFGGGVGKLAWMTTSHGLGFVVGGLVLSLWGGFKRKTATALMGFIGAGIFAILFGFTPTSLYALALAMMFLRTMMVPMIRGPVVAVFQAHVPPEVQGRIFTVLFAVVQAAAPLGLAVGGPLAHAYGARAPYILAGVGCLVIAVAWATVPGIMSLEAELANGQPQPFAGMDLGD